MREMGLEKARVSLGDIVDRVALAGEVCTITRNGKARAVLVSPEWYAQAAAGFEARARLLGASDGYDRHVRRT